MNFFNQKFGYIFIVDYSPFKKRKLYFNYLEILGFYPLLKNSLFEWDLVLITNLQQRILLRNFNYQFMQPNQRYQIWNYHKPIKHISQFPH